MACCRRYDNYRSTLLVRQKDLGLEVSGSRNQKSTAGEAGRTLPLLRAGRVSYEIQKEHRSKLLELIGKNHNSMGHGIWNLVTSSGNDREWDGVGKECIQENPMEEIISESFFYLYPSEKDLHYIIRGITINAILPVNEALQEWLKNDNYFKGQLNRRDIYGKLALNLADLEAHLLLWRAKFEVWIPDNPERAIVYMYDENRHGVPFPPNLRILSKNC